MSEPEDKPEDDAKVISPRVQILEKVAMVWNAIFILEIIGFCVFIIVISADSNNELKLMDLAGILLLFIGFLGGVGFYRLLPRL